MGDEVRQLEEEWAAACGTKHAVAVSSCTAALHLAAVGLWEPGAAVCVPSLTFVGAVDAVRQAGCTLKWQDIAGLAQPEATCPNYPTDIQVCHYAGRVAPALLYAQGYGLPIVAEDASHCYPGQGGVGWGAVACWSLHGTKNLTCGEGGMLTTDRDAVAEAARTLRRHGMAGTPGRRAGHYDVEAAGWNYAMSDVAAAIARVQLARCAELTDRRRNVLYQYIRRLGCLASPSAHLAVLLVPKGVSRDGVRGELTAAGIGTSIHYPPAHLLSTYRDGTTLPHTEAFAARCLSLPLHADMTPADADVVCDEVERCIG